MQLNSKLLQTVILVGNSILDFKSVDHVTYMYFTDHILMKNTRFYNILHNYLFCYSLLNLNYS